MGKQAGIIIGIIILLTVAFVGIKALRHTSSQQPVQTQTETMTPSPTETISASPSTSPSTSASSAQTTGSTKEFTVSGSNYKFEPSTITVKKGDSVKITFQNSGGFHDFALDEFNIKTAVIPSGQSTTVQFVADKAGTFQYYCSVGNHRAMGMQGTLTVQ